MRKVIDRNFARSESHKEDDPIAIKFKEFLRTELIRLGDLGDFRNWFVMNNQSRKTIARLVIVYLDITMS